MHIVLLTKTALNWIKFNSSKQNFNFSKYIPRERGGLPVFHKCAIKFIKYSPRMRGSTYGGVSGCRYANISLHMQGSTRSCVASFDHRNIPRERGGLPIIRNRGVLAALYSPRTRGSSLVCIMAEQEWNKSGTYSPRTRGSTLCGVSGCRYANISLHMQGSTRSCAASFDHRNIPRERGGHPTEQRLGTKYTIFPANAGVNLVWRVRVQVCEHSPCVSRDAPFSQILGISPSDYPLRWQGCSDAHLIQTIYCVLNSPYAGLALRNRCRFRRITPFLCFRRVGSSVRKKDAQLGATCPALAGAFQ